MSRQKLADCLLELSIKKDEYIDIATSISSVKSFEGIGRKYSPNYSTLKAIVEIFNVDYEYFIRDTSYSQKPIFKEKTLADYTTDELLAEIERRLKK